MDACVISPKKLIEVAIPLDAINDACAREKTIRHGHPSALHLWWARRPLAAARAVIFAQMVNDPESLWEAQNPTARPSPQQRGAFTRRRKELFELMRDLVQWENTGAEEVLSRARAEIARSWREICDLNKGHPQAPEFFKAEALPGFHDPFAGGGAIPLEAQRLGLQSCASDLNPVAVLINKAMIEIPAKFQGKAPVSRCRGDLQENPADVFLDLRKNAESREGWRGTGGLVEDIRYYGHWMLSEAQKRIGHLYPQVEITEAIASDRQELNILVGKKLSIISWIWVRTVLSPNPAFSDREVPLASTFVLCNKPGKEVYVEPIVVDDEYRFVVKQGKFPDSAQCGTKLARGANFSCILSQSPIEPNYVKTEGVNGRIGAKLLAVVADGPKGRVYLSPTPEMELLSKSCEPQWSPDLDLPEDPRNFWTLSYGLSNYRDLFTPRQLIALSTFSDLVGEVQPLIEKDAIDAGFNAGDNGLATHDSGAKAYSEAVCVYLAFLISKLADLNNSLTAWKPDAQCPVHLFARQAIPMVWDFAEANPLGASSGSWLSMMTNLERGLAGFSSSVPASGISLQADAAEQNLSNNRVISTDPPYYDNIGYADLSDFFYVWLRKSLKTFLPGLFATLAVPKAEELVASPYRHGSKDTAQDFFLNGMTRAMSRIEQQSHPAFPVTIYYAFKQSEKSAKKDVSSTGWETFLGAVIKAGFELVGTWPMRTEMKARQIAADTNALASSIVLVCRKRHPNAAQSSRREFLRELNKVLPKALDDMTRGAGEEQSPVAPVDLSQAIIGPGMAVFSKYHSVLEADGTPMGVKTALQLINRFLAEDDFDADTQFCLHWFEQYGWAEGTFGEADVLARSKATSVAGVAEAGAIKSGAGKVSLLRWTEYPSDWDPSTDQRTPVWEALHHLIRALKVDGEKEAGALLACNAGKAEAIRQLSYRLYTLCERQGWADDARVYNELISSWGAIEAFIADSPTKKPQIALFGDEK
jgi:putative DNA methylase